MTKLKITPFKLKPSEKELKALREAQKRLAWIDNVKRRLGYTQEEAERAYTRIFIEKKAI